MYFANALCKSAAVQWIIRSIPTLSYLIPLSRGNPGDIGMTLACLA